MWLGRTAETGRLPVANSRSRVRWRDLRLACFCPAAQLNMARLLGGHALGFAGSGLVSDIWLTFRNAGITWAAPFCLLLTLSTAFVPEVSLVTFQLLGIVAA